MGSQNLVYVESTHNPITSALADVMKDDWSKFKAYTDSTPHYDVWFSPWVSFHDACNSTSVHHAFVSAICDGIAIYEKNDIRPLLVTPVLTLHSSPL